jgi:hypothetical protein
MGDIGEEAKHGQGGFSALRVCLLPVSTALVRACSPFSILGAPHSGLMPAQYACQLLLVACQHGSCGGTAAAPDRCATHRGQSPSMMNSASSDPSSTPSGNTCRLALPLLLLLPLGSRRRADWRVGCEGSPLGGFGARGLGALGFACCWWGWTRSLFRPATASGIPRATRRARLRAMLHKDSVQ